MYGASVCGGLLPACYIVYELDGHRRTSSWQSSCKDQDIVSVPTGAKPPVPTARSAGVGVPRAGRKAGCRPAIPVASENENLSRVHDVVGVDRTLDGAHQVERRSELVLEIGHLALADAVLAGTGAVHGDGAGHQS